ncbi:hypothetical protein APSETT444_006505 [Aspergillus pseudonomiae]
MLLAVELLRQYSDIKGGLVFYDDTDDVPDHVTFAYNYIPTILGLSLMTLWSFTVYDVFRLEPYFQLSKEQIFPADVLSANYIFGPFISAPFSSARRKHWVVFGMSIINILVQLLLPSTLSALLDLDSVPMSSPATLRSWPELVAVGEQADWISSQRNMSLYSLTRGDLEETPSRLSHFAIPPVELPSDDTLATARWKVNHTVYWADLTCSDLPVSNPPTANVTVSIGETTADHSNYSTLTCALHDLRLASLPDPSQNCTFNANYSGIFDLTATPVQARRWELNTIPCAPRDVYGFLLDIEATDSGRLVGQRESPSAPVVVTPKAQFFSCDMQYYTAKAEVSMQANGSVVAIIVDKDSISALNSSDLDIAGFKTFLKSGICPTGNVCPSGNGTLTNHSLGQCDLGIGGYMPLCSTSGQYSQVPISGDEFMSKIRTDMKLRFARLLSRLFNTNAAYTPIQGVGTTDQVAVLVITAPAIASEIILLLGGVTCVFLAVFYQSRENILKSDPGSIAAMCSIVADLFNPAGVQTIAKYTDQSTARQLNRKLRAWQCYWYQEPSGRKLGFLPGEAPPRTLPVLGALFTQSRTTAAWPTQAVELRYDHSTILNSSTIPTLFQYGPIESTLLNSISLLPWTSPDYSFVPFSVHTDKMDNTYQAVTLGIGADLNCHLVPLTHGLPKDEFDEDSSVPNLTTRDTENGERVPSIIRDNASEPYSVQLLAPSGATDNGTLTVLLTLHSSSNPDFYSKLALQCHSIPRIQNFTIGFDPSGILQYYYPIDSAFTSGQLVDNVTSNVANYHQHFLASIQDTSGKGAVDEPKLFPSDWPGSLIKMLYENGNSQLTIIDPDRLADATQQVYQWLFAAYFSLQKDMYLKPLPEPIMDNNAEIMRPTWAIARSLSSFIVALIMVSSMVIALVLVFITRYGKFKGPRVPRSLGSVLVWLTDSPILPSFYGTYDWTTAARRDYLIGLDKRYIFRMVTTPTGEQKWVIEEDRAGKAG